MDASPFNSDELGPQALAGGGPRGNGIRDFMSEQHRHFFAQLPYLFVGAIDAAGWPLATLLTSQRHQWRHRGGLIVITPSADERWPAALLDLGIRGQRSLIVYLDPRGFGGTQPVLASAGRWRQALNWWIVRGAEDLDTTGERPLAAS